MSGVLKLVARRCPHCHQDESRDLAFGRSPWRVVQCVGCDFAYMPEVPDFAQMSTTFEWSQSFAVEAERRRRRSPVLARLDQLTRVRTRLLGKRNPLDYVRRHLSEGRIVDLGCGNGSYLAAAGSGFSLFGIDISEHLTAHADAIFRQHGGSAVCAPCSVGLQQFEPDFFDAAILRSYLEHEPEPAAVLRSLFRVLRPGGIAVVKVPNFASWNRHVRGRDWCGFRFPDHVNYFTPSSLRAMAAKHGYTVTMRAIDRVPTDDNMWAVLQRPQTAESATGAG